MKAKLWRGILMVVVVAIRLSILDACGDHEYKHKERCCRMCPPGTRVKKHCDQRVETECVACEDGSFTNKWTEKMQCSPCSQLRCGQGLKLKICTPTTNSVCQCIEPHHYLHNALLTCRPCRSCGQGEYPETKCSTQANAVCMKCPDFHFSNKSNNYNTSCDQCITCKKYTSRCNSTHDAICDDSKPTRTSPITKFPTVMSTNTPGKPEPSEKKEGSNPKNTLNNNHMVIIVAVISIISLIIVLCVLYLVVRRKLLCRKGIRFSPIRREANPPPLMTGLLLRDQPARIHLKLHKMLNPSGWKELASELGFTILEIRNFETNRETSAERMLDQWQAKNSATVDRLYEALYKIGREDVAKYLADNIDSDDSNRESFV